MHAYIEQDALTEEEDINKGENIFVQHKERGVVNKNWVLLDSQSTVNQIANPAFLSNIRKAKKASDRPLQRRINLQQSRRRIWNVDCQAQPKKHS